MKVYDLLTGADVLRMRKELRLGRDHLNPRCEFPNSKSAARLSNIELKESWKEGDKERVANALRSFYVERGLDVPELLSDAEVDEETAVARMTAHVQPDTGATSVPKVSTAEQVRASNVFREHVHGTSGWTFDGMAWVCAECGGLPESSNGAVVVAVEPAAGSTDEGTVVGTLVVPSAESVEPVVESLAQTERYADPTFPTTTLHEQLEMFTLPEVDTDEWEELLERLVEVDTSDVVQPDYRLTNSELRTFKRCRRQWWLAYYRKLGSKAVNYASAAATGGRVHRALAAAYSGDPAARVDPRDALERVIVEDWTELVGVVTDETELALVTQNFQKANELERAMVEGYVEWLAETGADADYTVTGAEQVLTALFTVEVDGRSYLVELLGKLDARLRRRSDGALLLIDHKTVQSLTDVLPTLRQNEQMLIYVLLEALNAVTEDDEYVSAALYNMLRKVKRTAQAKPPFYDRAEVHHNEYEVESIRRRVVGTAVDLLRVRDALDAGASHLDVAYPNPTGDCRWDCPFVRVCPMFDDGSPGVEDMLNQVYTVVDPMERYEGVTPTRSTGVTS